MRILPGLLARTLFTLMVGVSTVASAAPLPAPRPVSHRTRALARLPDGEGLRHGPCGSDLDAVPMRLAESIARPDATLLPTTYSLDAGEIAVLENDGSFFYSNSGGQPLLDIAAVGRAFYRTHGDDYDCLAVWLSSGMNQWLGSPGALAAAWVMRNDTQGIGLEPFDYGAVLGSPARMQWMLTMNGLHRYPADPDAPIGGPGDTFSHMDVAAHEFGHRWLSYVLVDSTGAPSPALLGRDLQHWGFFFDADSSFMEGCDWTAFPPDSFRTTGVSSTFGTLDQYLMGVRARSEVDSFFTVNAPFAFQPPGTYIPITTPFVGLGARGRATWWTLDDIEAVHGPRLPAGSATPQTVRVAFALVTPNGSPATPADLAKLEVVRQRFAATIRDATLHRMAIDATLDSRAGFVRIEHTPLRATEDPVSPRSVRARITVAGGSLPLGIDAASPRLWWRHHGAGAYASSPMVAAGADSFATPLTVPSGGGLVEYYISAASDSPSIAATLPPAGPAAPFSFEVGPDLTPPVIVTAPVPAQSRDRLPATFLARVTDNLGVDSVWVEYRSGSGPVVTLPASRIAPDSFTVQIGGGHGIGQTFAHRFVARDASVAGNLAASSVTLDSTRVVHNWVEDFENLSSWTPTSFLFSWRGAWHLSREASSPAGGTAWKCGSPIPGEPYPPHLDALLVSPWIPNVQPGTRVSFDHRYELEAADATHAWDGARLEYTTNNATWQSLEPEGGYPDTMRSSGGPIPRGARCWSGANGGFERVEVDLTPFAGGDVKIRFRMMADEYVGLNGWIVDRVRVNFPDDPTTHAPDAGGAPLALGATWPNPARDQLNLSLTLPEAAAVAWTLHDVQGRRVASLTSARLDAGTHALAAPLPDALRAGVYFARVDVNGRALATRRIAVVR